MSKIIQLTSYSGSATNLNLPTSIDLKKVKIIGYSAFMSKSITTVKGDETVNISDCAFYGCTSLTTASFPNCSYIGNQAFRMCSSLSIALCPSCSYVGELAFDTCPSLSTVSFPACSYIGPGAFTDTLFIDNQFSTSSIARLINSNNNFILLASDTITSAYTGDSETTFICGDAFNSREELTFISFPNCKHIDDLALPGCTSLSQISFPNCSYIGENAFGDCTSLATVSFPNCSYIGENAFCGCTSLSTVYFLSTSYVTGGWYMFDDCEELTSIYVPASMVNTYRTMDYWSDYADLIVGA